MDRPPRRALTAGIFLALVLSHLACSASKPISVRVDRATGELTVTDHRTHQDWRQTRLRIGPPPQQKLVSASADTMVFDCQLPAADRNWRPTLARFELTAKVDGDDLHLTFRHLDPARELYAVDYPYVFLPPFRDPHTVYPHGEGMLVPAAEYDANYLKLPDSDIPGIYSGLGAYMACLGLVSPATGQGLLTIFDSPELAGYSFHPAPDGLELPTLRLAADKYHLNRPQHFILHFSDEGGYVSLANRYRKYVADSGRHVTLADKHSTVPGASIFWLHDSPENIAAVAREMPAAGVERAVVGIQDPRVDKGEPPPDLNVAIGAITRNGYLASRYDQYRDSFRPDPAASGYEQLNRDAWPDAIVRKEDGSLLGGFGPNSGVINPAIGLSMARSHVPADLRDHPYTARFMDCYGSVGLGEGVDWSKDHPSDVFKTRHAREETLRFVRSLGLAVGTECGNDYLLPWLDWVDGPMTLVRWSDLPVGDGPKPPGKHYAVSISPKYRVPFYSLVHHDEVVITWRWEDGLGAVPAFDRDKELWCALYGNPPMYFMDRASWTAHRSDVARRERELGPWLRHVAGRRMTSHRFLTPDHLVQQTTFDDGSTAVVNFAERPFSLPDGRTIPAKGWLSHVGR